MLVIDASVAVAILVSGGGSTALEHETLVAPPILWSETTSAIHELAFRGDIAPSVAIDAIEALALARIERTIPRALYPEAARIARLLGWAKTYDAEYVALSRLTGARLLTRDARLRRGAARLTTVIGPEEL